MIAPTRECAHTYQYGLESRGLPLNHTLRNFLSPSVKLAELV